MLPGFGNTTPIDAFKNGDFSALLTGNQIAVDALGRPVFAGQIFNPATTHLVNGIPVRDPYPGNVIPANDPMRSLVASRVVPLMVHPDRAEISNNVAGNPAGDQTWELDARNIMARVDHNFSKRLQGKHELLLEPPSVGPQLRRGRRAAPCRTIRKPSRRRTPTTTATGSSSASPRSTCISSSTGSSGTTCSTTRRSPTTGGSWAGTTWRPARSGRSDSGPARPRRPEAFSTPPADLHF